MVSAVTDVKANMATPDDMQRERESNGQDLAKLERQVERGNLFVHTIVSRNADRIHETESFLYGAIDVLIEKGMLTQDEVLRAAAEARREMEEKGEKVGPGVALRIQGNSAKQDAFAPVNCSQRLHICKAACCRLHFALTVQEVESGRIKWDLGQPYFIRHDSRGCCTHLECSSGTCRIYADRPGVCKSDSCAGDARIWKDFEKMELNSEWIEANLSATEEPRVVRALMHDPDRLTAARRAEQLQASEGVKRKNL
jgi:Fe-S-cluster containining protein